MNRKKILSLMLSALLTLGLLSGCGGAQGVTPEPETQPEETAVSADTENAANTDAESVTEADDGVLRIAKQGVFAAGGKLYRR